jgi:hypothetical protein
MTLDLTRRLVKGSPLTAEEHDENLDVLEEAIETAENVPTNLSYDAAARVLASSTGDDATLPVVSTSAAGLAPATGTPTGRYLRDDGTWAAAIASNTAGITGADAITNIVSLTQAEYNAIASPNATTLYVITD